MGSDLGDDLDGPTEDTDKNPIPQIAKRKLKLPVPEDFDDDPTPVPKAPPPQSSKAPAIPKPPDRISVFRVPPPKSGSPIVLGIVGVLIAVATVAFLVAPDGKSAAEIARNQIGDPQHREGRSLKEWLSLGPSRSESSEPRIVESPVSPHQKRLEARPTPQPKRHAGGQQTKAGVNADERFGFERTDQPKRHYDNFDATKEQGTGIPMLMAFSKPSGMAVDVDGTLIGMTPLIRPLPKDTKRVKVRLYGAGFRDWEQTVSPNQIEQFKVGVTMQPIAE